VDGKLSLKIGAVHKLRAPAESGGPGVEPSSTCSGPSSPQRRAAARGYATLYWASSEEVGTPPKRSDPSFAAEATGTGA
jgi:hypothetical protein